MKRAEDTTLVLARAQEDSAAGRSVIEPEHRYVFSGDPQGRIAGYAVRPNRRAVRRPRSTFNIIVMLFGAGVAIVLYISNILAVNQLAHEVNELQTRYDKLVNANQVLRAEVDRRSAWERISKIATEELGLTYPKEQPTWFEVDEDRLQDVTAP